MDGCERLRKAPCPEMIETGCGVSVFRGAGNPIMMINSIVCPIEACFAKKTEGSFPFGLAIFRVGVVSVEVATDHYGVGFYDPIFFGINM